MRAGDRPFSITLEPVRGCNRRCAFCGIRGIARRPVEAMPRALASTIAMDLARWIPGCRISLNQRGEPTLHPDLPGLLSAMRRWLPKAQFTVLTNGYGLVKHGPGYARELFAAGANLLGVDDYDMDGTLEPVMTELMRMVPVHHLHQSPVSMWEKNPKGHLLQAVIVMPNIAKDASAIRRMNNRAGAVDPVAGKKFGLVPLEKPLTKRCAEPFRKLVVMVDGVVGLCCHEWRRRGVFGVFPDCGLREIWNGELRLAFLSLLGRGDRDFDPCRVCDYYGGFRLGLLPRVEFPGDAKAFIKREMKKHALLEEGV